MEQRINPRLKGYDYSSQGAYYITVCSHKRKHLFSRISVGRPLAAAVELSPLGKIAEAQLLDLENRFPNLKVDKYVIMPNHIHLILILDYLTAAASGRPTVSHVLRVWKSLTTRQCRQAGFSGDIWQDTFYDHIIRDERDYFTRWNYIDTNPARWADDEYYNSQQKDL